MKYPNVKFLTDTEIMEWNDKLKESPYTVQPRNSNQSPFMDLVVFTSSDFQRRADISGHRGGFILDETIDPHINYDFTFSVSSNRVEDFFDILSKIMSLKFESKFRYKEKIFDIEISDTLIKSKEVEEHIVIKRNYTRYTYKFAGKLSGIIGYISCLKDAIEYFQLIYGYGDEGEEYCLLNYPIGSIVSKKDDKSRDYLVLDYYYFKNTNNDYHIEYNCCEMLNTDSPIIQYGENIRCKDEELSFSRNNRIDDILN